MSSASVASCSQRSASSSASKGCAARTAVTRASGNAGPAGSESASLRAAPAAPAQRRGGQGFDHQHALRVLLAARQIAAVGEGEWAGEVELRESEVLGQKTPTLTRRSVAAFGAAVGHCRSCRRRCRRLVGGRGLFLPPLSGSEYGEGSVGTSGFSIWPS